MTDPIKELIDIMERSHTRPEELLPKVISFGPREDLEETDDTVDFGSFKAGLHRIATDLSRFLSDWFGSWLMVVLTGCAIGAIIGLVYRYILVPN
jgi:hypothetical protein